VASNLPAVVRPMEHRLSLFAAAFEIASLAILFDGRDVARDRTPPPDLPRVVSSAASRVVPAVPLKPATRILRMNPPIPPPNGERLRRIDSEVVQRRIMALRTQLRSREPARGKLAAAVGHVLPAEDAETKHGLRCQLGSEPWREATHGLRPPVDVPVLHRVVNDHFPWCHARTTLLLAVDGRSPRSARSAIRASMPRNMRP